MISTILIGNNLVNIVASVYATSFAIIYFGEFDLIFVTILLTIVFFVTSCSNIDSNSYLTSQNEINDKKKVQTKKYVGWWIFGENMHLFKENTDKWIDKMIFGREN